MGRKECCSNGMQPGLCREANVHRAGLSTTTGRRYRFVPIEYSEPRAIEKDFELFTLHLTESLSATHQASVYGGDLDGVLAVSGKLVTNQ